jgi:hypothetical protein
VVLLEDVYDEFNDGLPAPEALRSFLTHARGTWATPPRFAALAGAGTYDYCGRMGYGDNLVPPLLVATPYGLYAADMRYGDADGDGAPEVVVGRLPARTAAELNALVDKIQSYESAAEGNWQKAVVLAADNPDAGGDFEAASERVASRLAADSAPERIFAGRVGPSQARSELLGALNAGAAFVSYFGHAGMDRLAAEGLLTASDVPGLRNGERLPILTAMTCVMGQFAVPGYDCLGETLLLHPAGGAAAVWAPSGLSRNEPAQELAESLYGAVFRDGDVRLGDAVGRALRSYAQSGRSRALPRIYNLLGDPALRVTGRSAARFDDWARDHFSATDLADAAVGGILGDPDADSLQNLGEYALGANPKQPGGAPGLQWVTAGAGAAGAPGADGIVVRFVRAKGLLDMAYRVDVSEDLRTWYSGSAYVLDVAVADDGNGRTETVTCRVRMPRENATCGFVRLRVERP